MKYPAIKKNDTSVYKILKAETLRQEEELQLIASENYASPAVMEAQGSVMTNKYAEGYPGRRYYQGMKHYDEVENLAIERAKKIFGAEHVNVQPSSGSQANMAATLAVLEHGDTLMGMDLACGGHLTHGMKLNYSGQMFKVASYPVRKDDFRLDYDQIMAVAREARARSASSSWDNGSVMTRSGPAACGSMGWPCRRASVISSRASRCAPVVVAWACRPSAVSLIRWMSIRR